MPVRAPRLKKYRTESLNCDGASGYNERNRASAASLMRRQACSAVDAFLDFCDLVHAQDYHECWSMTWLDTLREGKSLTLRLGVHTGLDDMPDQVWEVGARYTRVFSLVEFEFTAWTISDDHVCSGTHQEPFSQLNFRGPASSHGEILWDLHERHREVAGHWIPFDRYINSAFLVEPPLGRLRRARRRARPASCANMRPFSRKATSSRISPIRRARRTRGTPRATAGSTATRISRC